MRLIALRVALAAALAAAGCGGTQPSDVVTIGVWGGDGIEMVVTATGATLDFGCDTGTIDQPLVASERKAFSAAGTYAFGRGGPSDPADPALVPHPARYDATIVAPTLHLVVFVTDLSRNMGEFRLVAGRRGSLDRCL